MASTEPLSARAIGVGDRTPAAWSRARGHLEQADFFWLSTARPDGQPHVRPILAVWLDGACYFSTNASARKAENLAHNARCAIAVRGEAFDLVVKGEAARVRDESKLQRVADVFKTKYDWPETVRDGAFDAADGAPTAGPPPYVVYEVTPATVFGFALEDRFQSTRWRF